MATRSKKSQPAEEFEDLPTQEEISYAEFLDDLGDTGVTVQIFRHPKVGKDLEWCEDAPIDGARLDVLREKWGPGKYSLKFKGQGSRYLGHRTVSIAPVYDPKPASNGSTSADFQEKLILALIAKDHPPAPAPFDLGGFLQGLAAMQANNKPAPASDPAAMLAAITGVFTTLKGAATPEDPLTRFKDAVGFVKDIMPDKGGAGEDNVYTVVKEVGEKLVETAGAVFGARTQVANRPPIPPGARPMPSQPAAQIPAPAAAVEPPPPPAKTQEEILREWVAVQIKFLKEKAKAGKEPEFWVEYIFENQEEPGCDAILIALERGYTLEHLLQFDAEIRDNPALKLFFEKLCNGLLAGLKQPMDSAGAAGDAGNTGSHAPAGDPGQPPAGNSSPGT